MNLLDEKRKLIPTGQYRNAQAFWDNYISPTFVAPIKREIINPINREIVAPIRREVIAPINREIVKPVVREIQSAGRIIDREVLQPINNKILKPVEKAVSTMVEMAQQDPIGTIAKIVTAVVAPELLPFVTGANTLAHGGSLEDAVKSGGFTYLAMEAGSYGTQYGTQFGEQISSALNIGEAGVGVAKALGAVGGAVGATSLSIVAGKGGDLSVAAANAFIGSYIGNAVKDIPGFDALPSGVKNATQRIIGSGLTAAVSGRNIDNAVMSSLDREVFKMAGDYMTDGVKVTLSELDKKATDFLNLQKKSGDLTNKSETAVAKYNDIVSTYNTMAPDASDKAQYQAALEKYTKNYEVATQKATQANQTLTAIQQLDAKQADIIKNANVTFTTQTFNWNSGYRTEIRSTDVWSRYSTLADFRNQDYTNYQASVASYDTAVKAETAAYNAYVQAVQTYNAQEGGSQDLAPVTAAEAAFNSKSSAVALLVSDINSAATRIANYDSEIKGLTDKITTVNANIKAITDQATPLVDTYNKLNGEVATLNKTLTTDGSLDTINAIQKKSDAATEYKTANQAELDKITKDLVTYKTQQADLITQAAVVSKDLESGNATIEQLVSDAKKEFTDYIDTKIYDKTIEDQKIREAEQKRIGQLQEEQLLASEKVKDAIVVHPEIQGEDLDTLLASADSGTVSDAGGAGGTPEEVQAKKKLVADYLKSAAQRTGSGIEYRARDGTYVLNDPSNSRAIQFSSDGSIIGSSILGIGTGEENPATKQEATDLLNALYNSDLPDAEGLNPTAAKAQFSQMQADKDKFLTEYGLSKDDDLADDFAIRVAKGENPDKMYQEYLQASEAKLSTDTDTFKSETIQKVLDAAESLGKDPNEVGRIVQAVKDGQVTDANYLQFVETLPNAPTKAVEPQPSTTTETPAETVTPPAEVATPPAETGTTPAEVVTTPGSDTGSSLVQGNGTNTTGTGTTGIDTTGTGTTGTDTTGSPLTQVGGNTDTNAETGTGTNAETGTGTNAETGTGTNAGTGTVTDPPYVEDTNVDPPEDTNVDTKEDDQCGPGFHWDEARQLCISDEDVPTKTVEDDIPTSGGGGGGGGGIKPVVPAVTPTTNLPTSSEANPNLTNIDPTGSAFKAPTITPSVLTNAMATPAMFQSLNPDTKAVDITQTPTLDTLDQVSGMQNQEQPQSKQSYYNYGVDKSPLTLQASPFFNPSTSQYQQANDVTGLKVANFKGGGLAMSSPLMAASGGEIPHKGSHYVQGAGGGQDDLIDARLADGEYVFDADIVAALGDGSNKEGAKKLDAMREAIRKHKRSAAVDSIPPKAKSPLAYLKGKA